MREPTGDPDRYLIPTDQVPAGLAARLAEGAGAVDARPAATVVLVRPGASDPEVLLLRRPGRSSFAANAWVFPGGVVDDQDGSGAIADRLLGASPEWWAERLATTEDRAVAFVATALREAWEETGILLCEPAVDGGALEAARLAVLSGESRLAQVLASEGLRLDARDLVYIAHWITPEPETRRYDTRFFLAPVAEGVRCDLVGDELCDARWITPAEAVSAFRAGTLRLLPPTAHTLRGLARYTSVGEITRSLRGARVPVILPRMSLDPGGVVIEIPRL